MNGRAPLAGCGVLVTRPQPQARSLMDCITAAGGRALHLPALEIAPPADPGPLRAALTALADFDLALFTSANAVRGLLAEAGGRLDWPGHLAVGAVGSKTAAALEAAGIPVSLVPEAGFDSERLLALPALAGVAGRRLLLVAGEGGRDLLRETLAGRGAEVVRVAAYRRRRPRVDPAPVLAAWSAGAIQAVTVASNESLHNLFELIGQKGQTLLRDSWVVVPGRRADGLAGSLGIRRRIIAANATDEAMCQALVDWAAGRQGKERHE